MQNSTVLTATFKHLFQREPGQDTKSQCHMKKKANIWCLHCLLFMADCKFWLSKHTFTTNNWRKTEGNADIPAVRLYGKPLKVKAFSFLCVKLSSE